MTPAIRAQKLSKCYAVGSRPASYRTLRETLTDFVATPWRRLRQAAAGRRLATRPSSTEAPSFWALHDISFEIQPGEVVGIIGPNGSGKSTLLKILSRIVEPTSGRVTLHGRVGSLLEVGTGFHPELTGRENIYLNGAVLGMRQREIARKFDDIVAFADIEPFLDTPVKRYSSGMYVRLAFAVAAHLEPDILLVDEVLAVGDADFQRRCLHKMDEISASGRTVLLVSHNLASIQALCKLALTLDQGKLLEVGPAAVQVSRYLGRLVTLAQVPLQERRDRDGTGRARVTHLRFADGQGQTVEHAFSGGTLKVVIGYQAQETDAHPDVLALSFWSLDGQKIFHVDNRLRGVRLARRGASGEYACNFPRLPLLPGRYYLNVLVGVNQEVADHVFAAAALHVLPGDYYGTGKVTSGTGGLVYVDHEWN
ncbi:MAG: ABC transporter ATP-binding protein [Gemmataceae bacterium]|nr:ABC transporter ATP-binding protein [Gemmataceae bacterium]